MKELIKEYPKVLFEREGSVAYLTLNDPENKNPVTVEIMADLCECLNYCEREDNIRAIVIRGAGGSFSAGGNVKAMKERLDKGINAFNRRSRLYFEREEHKGKTRNRRWI